MGEHEKGVSQSMIWGVYAIDTRSCKGNRRCTCMWMLQNLRHLISMSEVGTMAAYLEYTQVGTAIYGRLSVARNGSVKERVMYVHVQPNMYILRGRAPALRTSIT